MDTSDEPVSHASTTVDEFHRLLRNHMIKGSIQLAIDLIESESSNFDLNAEILGDSQDTFLSLAVSHGHASICTLLISKGCDVNTLTSKGASYLYHAAQEGHSEVIRALLEANANPSLPNMRDKEAGKGFIPAATPLMVAAYAGHIDCLLLLLAAGASLTSRDLKGLTPLHYAAMGRQIEAVCILLSHGADPFALNSDGRTPRQLAEISEKISEKMLEMPKPKAKATPASSSSSSFTSKSAFGLTEEPKGPITRFFEERGPITRFFLETLLGRPRQLTKIETYLLQAERRVLQEWEDQRAAVEAARRERATRCELKCELELVENEEERGEGRVRVVLWSVRCDDSNSPLVRVGIWINPMGDEVAVKIMEVTEGHLYDDKERHEEGGEGGEGVNGGEEEDDGQLRDKEESVQDDQVEVEDSSFFLPIPTQASFSSQPAMQPSRTSLARKSAPLPPVPSDLKLKPTPKGTKEGIKASSAGWGSPVTPQLVHCRSDQNNNTISPKPKQQQQQQQPPRYYICPLTSSLMQDPVTASDKQVYERAAIEMWMGRSALSPVTKQQMPSRDPKQLLPNQALRNAIRKWANEHSVMPLTPEGDRAKVALESRLAP